MNKQELLDKAVHKLDGVYANSSDGGGFNEDFLWHVGGNCYQRLDSNHGFIGEFVCTKDEFQQRARELGYLHAPTVKESLPDEWYDYDNQKAIALPPVNELVEAAIPHTNGRGEQSVIWIEGLVIAHHKIKENVYSWFVEPDNGFYPPNVLQFRPLDWNRKAEAEKKRVVDAAMKIASGGMTKEMYEALYDAGYLKLPE